jgi:sortase A
MRRVLGTVLSVAGGGILLLVALGYVNGAIARDRARAQWAAVEAHSLVVAAQNAANAPAHITYAPGALVGRLLIPAVGLDEVVSEGVGAAQLDAGPGHLPGSAAPGEAGNAIISAHRDRHFHSLGRVALGDTVITETLDGRTTWVVIARRIVRRDEPALFPTPDPTLTLTTCWPIVYVGSAPDRLLITAKPLKRSPRA